MTTMDPEQVRRWRLTLGASAEQRLQGAGYPQGRQLLSEEDWLMDEALAAIYEGEGTASGAGPSGQGNGNTSKSRSAGLGASSPKLAKWLGDVRHFFPPDVVSVIEGGNRTEMIRRLKEMHESGVKTVCLLALSDDGVPSYDTNRLQSWRNTAFLALAARRITWQS